MVPDRKSISAIATAALLLFGLTGQCRAAEPGDAAPELTRYAIESGGMARTYAASVPDQGHGGPRTLLLEIHGSGSHPDQQRIISGLTGRLRAAPVVVVYPEAVVPGPVGLTWNVPPDPDKPDDVQYLLDVVDDAAGRFGADGSRVYLVGFSGGARLASEFSARAGDRVAAFAAVGGLRAPSQRGPAVPVIAFHGTDDPINPWPGGGAPYWGYGVEAAVSGWLSRTRCMREVSEPYAPGIVRRACVDRRGFESVVLFRFDGGHVWPGSAFQFPERRFGKMPGSLDATGMILEFFQQWSVSENISQAASH